MSVSNQSKSYFSMDMCDGCADRQQWLLDSGDGSQVICLCQVENSQVEDNTRYDGEVATTIDVGIQTPPLKRSSPFIPNAPKRKFAKFESSVWINSGSDIRRHLFDFEDCRIMGRIQDRKWAILKVDTIRTSKDHLCIRRFYIGDKDGVNYLEAELYPCVKYANLAENFKFFFLNESNRKYGHKLRYNPRQRSPPCTLFKEKIEEFVKCNNIDLILYNTERGSVSEDIYSNIDDTISVGFLNIRWEFRCG